MGLACQSGRVDWPGLAGWQGGLAGEEAGLAGEWLVWQWGGYGARDAGKGVPMAPMESSA